MHMVECPYCRRTFRVPKPMTDTRMKCGGCGRSFVGSSTEAPIPGGRSAPVGGAAVVPPPPQPAPPPVRPVPSRSAGPVTLVVCCVGVAGIIVLLAAFYWVRTHPTQVVKEPEGTGGLQRRPGGAAAGSADGAVTGARPGEADPTAGQSAGPEGQLRGDPKLSVTGPALVGGAVGEKKFACGTVLSRYAVALRGISVTAYVDGLRGPSVYYPYVPPGGAVRYCVPFRVQELDEDRIKIVAAGEPAGADLVVWEVPQEEIRRAAKAPPEMTVWTGTVRNRGDVPVKNIRIILDYYDDEGVWGGRAEGRLEDRTTLGPSSSGSFRVTTGELNALEVVTSRILVARAVAEKL